MIPTLILDLGVPAADQYDNPALPTIAQALAVMLVLGVGDVASAAEAAGRTGSSELRDALFYVFIRAADLLEPDGPRRQADDPLPDAERRAEVMGSLLAAGVARLSGDWGDDVRVQAARLVEGLARWDPAWMLPNLPALLGALLRLVDDMRTPPRTLEVVAVESPQLQVLERIGWETAISSAATEVLDAIEAAAAADPLRTVAAVTTLITEERDSARGPDTVWWLLRPLGRIGGQHGDKPRVLRAILPTLHSYLLDTDSRRVRKRSINGWRSAASTNCRPACRTCSQR